MQTRREGARGAVGRSASSPCGQVFTLCAASVARITCPRAQILLRKQRRRRRRTRAGQVRSHAPFPGFSHLSRYWPLCRVLTRSHRHGLQRVAIVDFDVHHGNGTQAGYVHPEAAGSRHSGTPVGPMPLSLAARYPPAVGRGAWQVPVGPVHLLRIDAPVARLPKHRALLRQRRRVQPRQR